MKQQYLRTTTIAATFLTLFFLSTAVVHAGPAVAKYMVTIENLTQNQAFTPPVIATHRPATGIFTVGETAAFELKEIAENGNLDPMIDALTNDKHVSDFVAAGAPSPLLPGGSVTVPITADSGAKFLSYAAMLICTNDGFTGVDTLGLPKKVGDTVTMFSEAYDAGTEINTEDFADIVPPCPVLSGVPSSDPGSGVSDPALLEGGVIRQHDGIDGTLPDSDLTVANHGWVEPVAKITVTRVENKIFKVNLIGAGPGAGSTGTVMVVNRPFGPDSMRLKMEGLPPNERMTVFLTEDQVAGGLPAQFIGEFTTNAQGKGKLHLRAEIVNAFASANQQQEDANGVARNVGIPPPPGLLPTGGTANTISLNWFRGYFVDIKPAVPDTPGTVFGPDETTPGGVIAFFSDVPLP